MKKILEQIAVTAELMGQTISPNAAAVMAADLSKYPEKLIVEALTIVRCESKGRFSLAAVIEQIEKLNPDGRPGVEEAWAMIPRDEAMSVVLTQEMMEAWGVAKPLIDEGDMVAARMAFKEAYLRMVDVNKREDIAPKWFPCLGHDKDGREGALHTGVRLGRIGLKDAAGLLPPDQAIALLANGKTLALEHKQEISPEKARENIARIKAMLGTSKLINRQI